MYYCVPQVSKTAPTGEYLTTGSFMIRGNDLPVDYGDRFEDHLLIFSEQKLIILTSYMKSKFCYGVANLAFDMSSPYIFLLMTVYFHIVYIYKGKKI